MSPSTSSGRTDHVEKSTSGYVHQISVSNGGVPKWSIPEAWISFLGVEGDRQNSIHIHGGPDRAVCLFSLDLIEALRREGHSITPGASGENLTLAGVQWGDLVPDSRIRIGETVELQITSFTAPCKLNARWFHDDNYGRISQKQHPGWSRLYARVLCEGRVRTGDAIEVFDVRSSMFGSAIGNRSLVPRKFRKP